MSSHSSPKDSESQSLEDSSALDELSNRNRNWESFASNQSSTTQHGSEHRDGSMPQANTSSLPSLAFEHSGQGSPSPFSPLTPQRPPLGRFVSQRLYADIANANINAAMVSEARHPSNLFGGREEQQRTQGFSVQVTPDGQSEPPSTESVGAPVVPRPAPTSVSPEDATFYRHVNWNYRVRMGRLLNASGRCANVACCRHLGPGWGTVQGLMYCSRQCALFRTRWRGAPQREADESNHPPPEERYT